jgi:hypothetical protein
MDNIAYLLFLDVVKWYGNQNTVTMTGITLGFYVWSINIKSKGPLDRGSRAAYARIGVKGQRLIIYNIILFIW